VLDEVDGEVSMIAFCSVLFCTSFRTCMLMRYPSLANLSDYLSICASHRYVVGISDEVATKNHSNDYLCRHMI
jgi:exopolysaccharide biosynthesis predicted pyruvyltransferase EpsI